MNNKKDKRLLGEIATLIVITVLIIAYYIFYFFALAYLLEGSALRIIMGILPLLFYNDTIAINSNIENTILDANGNIDFTRIKK